MAQEELHVTMSVGDSLPSLPIYWQKDDDSYYDFTTDWTFEIVVYDSNGVKFTKTTGITGAAGTADVPNIVADWGSGEISSVTAAGDYKCQVRAVQDGEPLTKTGVITLDPAI